MLARLNSALRPFLGSVASQPQASPTLASEPAEVAVSMPEKNSEVDMGPLPRASSSRQVIEIQDSELEEGEINDEPEVELVSESKSASCMPEEQPAFSRSNKRQRTSTEGLISPGKKKKKERKLLDPEHSAPSLNPEATPFQGQQPKQDVHAESRSLIAEMLTVHRMSPEHLIQFGVSKELVVLCLVELDYPIPSHLAHLAPRKPTQKKMAPPLTAPQAKVGSSQFTNHSVSSPQHPPKASTSKTPTTAPLSASLPAKPLPPKAPSRPSSGAATHHSQSAPQHTPKSPTKQQAKLHNVPSKPSKPAPHNVQRPPVTSTSSKASTEPATPVTPAPESSTPIASSSAQSVQPPAEQKDMHAHEKGIRDQLMARRKQKEEEKRRKIATEQDEQQRELALETSMQRDIDGLFATVLVNTPSTTSDAQDWDSSENSVPNQPHASDTGRLDVPESQGPSISPNHRQLNSLSEPGPSLLGARRPKASDFEGEPTAPSAALAVPGRASFLPDSAPGINLVIEFDEEDHDIASAYHKGDSFESAAQSTQLEKRELELKRLREKVALMEKKRKNRAASQSRASTPTQGDVHTPISASVPSPSKSFEVSSASTSAQNALVPVSSTALGYAQDEIQRLQQERMALMADHLAVENISETQGNIFPDADARSSYETAPASPEPVDMVIDTSPIDDTFDAINQEDPMVISPVHHVEASPARSQIQDPQEAQNLPVTSECMVGPSRTSTSEGLFTEYRSPLVGSSLRVSAAPQTLLASDELVQQARSALHSFVVRKRRIDITRQWCRFESDGGICVDNSCPRLHASQITPEEQDLEEFFWFWFRMTSETNTVKKSLFSRGLATILQRFPRENFGDILLAVYQLTS